MYPSNKSYFLSLFLFISFLLGGCNTATQETDIANKRFESSETLHDEWMGAYFKGKKIGYIHGTTERGRLAGQPSIMVKSIAKIEINIENQKNYTELEQEAFIDKEGKLLAFNYNQNIMGHQMVVRGERRDGNLFVEIDAGGEKRRKKIPLSENTYTSGLIKEAILHRGLKVGDEIVLSIFLEPLLTVEPVSVKVLSMDKGFVGGKETNIFTVEENFKGITGTLRITEGGLTVEETSPHGFQLLSLGKKEAMAQGEALSIVDLLLASKIDVNRKIVNPRSLHNLKLKLKNIPSHFPVIDDDNQKIISSIKGKEASDYIFDIHVRPISDAGVTIPVKHSFTDHYLTSDHVVNADNKTIINKAREVVGNEKSALQAAKKIYVWVNKNIKKRLVDTVSALDTLKSGEGECQAHANLYAALARAGGIPTKVISGLVYSEEFGGFMYHAWNEVYIGQWVPLDPTLGGFPADATHLKLSEGGLADQLKIMALVG
ncbi:MAG: transglutaminase domain-containing protein, partial [Proteobacteria bacterium]|nr:transglutaminase domain-containing protein [Pseudomonadota bacterium]